ncbi:MAG TPA: AbrB/MazE/SpoVT family DNA-binding domain-containing protein [Thermoanaerobaculia bacterium]
MSSETAKIGKRGTVVIPARLRQRLGLVEGTLVLLEEGPGGLTIRPATALPIEVYTPERKAELLLNNSVDAEDYAGAVEEVCQMGLDPEQIPHRRP